MARKWNFESGTLLHLVADHRSLVALVREQQHLHFLQQLAECLDVIIRRHQGFATLFTFCTHLECCRVFHFLKVGGGWVKSGDFTDKLGGSSVLQPQVIQPG